jgi:hypothetical protein
LRKQRQQENKLWGDFGDRAMSNGITINKETFRQLDTDTKLDSIFDVLVNIHEECKCRFGTCEVRFKRLENRKIKDKGLAATAGLVGGFLAHVVQKVISGGNP